MLAEAINRLAAAQECANALTEKQLAISEKNAEVQSRMANLTSDLIGSTQPMIDVMIKTMEQELDY